MIRDHQVDGLGFEKFKSSNGCGGGKDPISCLFQQLLAKAEGVGFIVNAKHCGRTGGSHKEKTPHNVNPNLITYVRYKTFNVGAQHRLIRSPSNSLGRLIGCSCRFRFGEPGKDVRACAYGRSKHKAGTSTLL